MRNIGDILREKTPRSRLSRQKEFWGDNPPPDVAGKIEAIEVLMGENGSVGWRGLLLLAQLEHLRTIEEWNTDPDTIRGEKIGDAASHGHSAVHGTADEKAARWMQYQADLEESLAETPHLSLTAARRIVADKHGVCLKTISRRTTNPRKT